MERDNHEHEHEHDHEDDHEDDDSNLSEYIEVDENYLIADEDEDLMYNDDDDDDDQDDEEDEDDDEDDDQGQNIPLDPNDQEFIRQLVNNPQQWVGSLFDRLGESLSSLVRPPAAPLDDEMDDYVPETSEQANTIRRLKQIKAFDLFATPTTTLDDHNTTELFNHLKVISLSSFDRPFTKFVQDTTLYLTSGHLGKNRYEEIKNNQKVPVCGKVFITSEWAFQCKQCQEDETSIQCEKCFRSSNHEGHDVLRVRVGGGGCCDCGDKDSWKATGFCTEHRDIVQSDEEALAPLIQFGPGHIAKSERLLGILLDLILLVLDKKIDNDLFGNNKLYFHYSNGKRDTFDVLMPDEMYGVLIHNDSTNTFEGVSGALKFASNIPDITVAMCGEYAHYVHMNEQCVVFVGTKEQCNVFVSKMAEKITLKCTLSKRFKLFPFSNLDILLKMFAHLSQLNCFKRIFCNLLTRPTGSFHHNDGRTLDPRASRLARFFVSFQTLPRTKQGVLKDWLFSLTFDRSFKVDFSVCYGLMYPNIIENFVNDIFDYEYSLLSLSIQIFTIPFLATSLAEHHGQLDIFFNYIRDAVPKYAVKDNLTPLTFTSVLDRKYNFERFKLTLSDLQYLISVKPIFKNMMLNDPRKITPLLQLLALFHLSHPNVRSTEEYKESNTWTVFFVDTIFLIKIFTSILKSLIPHGVVGEDDVVALTKTVDMLCYTASQMPRRCDGISINLPVHRCLAMALTLAIQHHDQNRFTQIAKSLWEDDVLAETLLYGLANIDNLIAESKSRMWLRNGTSLELQIVNYTSQVFHRQFTIEHDFALKQIICCSLRSDRFLRVYMSHFTKLDNLLKQTDITLALDNNEIGVLSNFYRSLITLISDRSLVGQQTTLDIIRYDVIHQLFIKNRTFTKLAHLVGIEKGVSTNAKDLENVLKQVATFMPPTKLSEQGKFALKQEYYSKFNKYYFGYSTKYREKAEEIVQQHYKTKGAAANEELRRVPIEALAPLKPQFAEISNIFVSPLLYRIIYNSLYQCVVPSLTDATPLDEYDTQRRSIERSDVIDHIIHMMFLALDSHPDRIDYIKQQCSNKTHNESNTSIVDMLIAIHADSARKYFHPSIVQLLNRLEESKQLEANSLRVSASEQEDIEKHNRMLQAKRKVLEQFSTQQQKFSMLLQDEDISDEEDAAGEVIADKKGVCILCREENYYNDLNNPIGYFCLMQSTRLMKVLEERNSLEPEYGIVDKTEQELFAKRVRLQKFGNYKGETVLQLCGHAVHVACYNKMEKVSAPGKQYVVCPLCQSFSNAIMPPIPNGFSIFGELSHSTLYKDPSFKDSKLHQCFKTFGDSMAKHLYGNSQSIIRVFQSTLDNIEFISRSNQWSLEQATTQASLQTLRSLLDVIFIYISVLKGTHYSEIEYGKESPFNQLLNQLFVPLASQGQIQSQTHYMSATASLFDQHFNGGSSVDSTTTTTTTTTTSMSTSIPMSTSPDKPAAFNDVDTQFYEQTVFLRKLAILDKVLGVSRHLPAACLLSPSYLTGLIAHLNSSEHRQKSVHHQFTSKLDLSKLSGDIIERQPPHFSLARLPENYDDILRPTFKCKKCDSTPERADRAICLLCSRIVCIGSRCCAAQNNIPELLTHPKVCGGDACIFLFVEHSSIIVVYNTSFGLLGSPYLDSHGEEDSGLRRGTPLFLSKERYQLINNIILKSDVSKSIEGKSRNQMNMIFQQRANNNM
ncbi:hypothetical protein SAMD00019534_062010 [Acytostelium subglobosum LB1]|uniref:hypothetical protein n=1 Tax=Acytostelium subglobosum LB1 TaxID=1410327 RepID=UPI000645233D|nr:hypothetical protein SAMD00019534_062010 [Acytostelium subglobosum LB1]GAM23026.1 hypothetical protein SAMD00019534_062010 [Acytostelium subglobosum LB1]|eukprot:XP_012754253.1 hypothetical protein SAMD00019534_062010 [Acytostelium subglobosum LB1]